MEYLYKIMMIATSGFWQFIGISFLLAVFVNGVIQVCDELFNFILKIIRGYPPATIINVPSKNKEEIDGK